MARKTLFDDDKMYAQKPKKRLTGHGKAVGTGTAKASLGSMVPNMNGVGQESIDGFVNNNRAAQVKRQARQKVEQLGERGAASWAAKKIQTRKKR